jgi:hypothetical protein
LAMTSLPDTEQQREEKTQKLAARLLRRSRLRPNQGVSRGQVAAALVKALGVAGPRSPHGQLLVAALTPATAPRAAAESAVRMLLRYGQVPTPAAVGARVAARDQHERAMVSRAQAQRHAIAQRLSDGPAAAALVAKHWEAHGHGPTWHELGYRLGWPYRQVGPTVRALAAAGWLTPGIPPRSLRPGPRFDLDQAPGPPR